jgi:hypothetical protein
VRMCRCKLPVSVAAYGQCGHWYGRSPVCVRMCACKWPASVAAHGQCGHWYGRLPVCVRMCACKLLAVDAAYGQCGQRNGRSPVCVRMCLSSFEGAANALPHSLHRCLFLSIIIPSLSVGSLASAMVVAHVREEENKSCQHAVCFH